ncbi:MAG TPA: hypothetical protein VN903_15535 [Polyangia bacterium]|nr:hypothetical protein [Polyangia bacterium]
MAMFGLSWALSACGEVTGNGSEETQACAKKACHGADCPPPGDGGHGMAGAGDGCSSPRDGSAGSGGTTGTGGAVVPVATDLAEFPCTVCRKAENCCKAEGLTDCGYTAACTNAPNADQMQYYLALCRAMLEASAGSKKPPDVCGL